MEIPYIINEAFTRADKCIKAVGGMCSDAKVIPEHVSFAIDIAECGQLFFGADLSDYKKDAQTVRNFVGLPALLGQCANLTKLKVGKNGSIENFAKFIVDLCKVVKYGRSQISYLVEKKVLKFPGMGIVDEYKIIADGAGIVASAIELGIAVSDVFLARHTIQLINSGKGRFRLGAMGQNTFEKCSRNLRWEGVLTIVKSICSIVISVFKMLATYAGMEKVDKVLTLSVSLTGNSFGTLKHFTGHYNKNITLQMKKAKEIMRQL